MERPMAKSRSAFVFELGERALNHPRDRQVTIVGRSEFIDRPPAYRTRWRDAHGVLQEEWLDEKYLQRQAGGVIDDDAAAPPSASAPPRRPRRRSRAKSRRAT